MIAVIGRATSPDVPIGPHCSDPYDCAMQSLCWQFLPNDNVLTLSRINKEKAFNWISQGIVSLKDVPSGEKLTAQQEIQVKAAMTGMPHVNREKIEEFMRSLRYPLYFMDFELEPFRAFHYYHPSQQDSASIKQVLPALTGKSYDGMDISEGGTASREYLRVTFTDVADADRRKVRKALDEYSKLETQGMVDVLGALRDLR